MFFNLTWRNAKRSRSENLIYFLTMITAVAMFYIVEAKYPVITGFLSQSVGIMQK